MHFSTRLQFLSDIPVPQFFVFLSTFWLKHKPPSSDISVVVDAPRGIYEQGGTQCLWCCVISPHKANTYHGRWDAEILPRGSLLVRAAQIFFEEKGRRQGVVSKYLCLVVWVWQNKNPAIVAGYEQFCFVFKKAFDPPAL